MNAESRLSLILRYFALVFYLVESGEDEKSQKSCYGPEITILNVVEQVPRCSAEDDGM